MRILVVEDNNISNKIMMRLLEPLGKCQSVTDGEIAVSAIKESLENKEPFDVIFLDIMIPKLDGREVLKKIRELEAKTNTDHRMKVIMTSALGDKETKDAAYSDQCDGYLVKPMSKDDLTEQLRALDLISS